MEHHLKAIAYETFLKIYEADKKYVETKDAAFVEDKSFLKKKFIRGCNLQNSTLMYRRIASA